MECIDCQDFKLSREFPLESIGKQCTHAPSTCLECLEKSLEIHINAVGNAQDNYYCPECNEEGGDIEFVKRALQDVKAKLNGLKVPVLQSLVAKKVEEADMGESGKVHVCLLSGDSCTIDVDRSDSSFTVKKKIRESLQVDVPRQRLFYKGKEVLEGDKEKDTWGSFGIPFGETLHCVILLYEVAADRDAVRLINYEISWQVVQGWGGYRHGQDGTGTGVALQNTYIDIIGIVYEQDFTFLEYVHGRRRNYKGIDHGGLAYDTCQQFMKVDCDKLPPHAAFVYFVLAAAPNEKAQHKRHVTLANFRDPQVVLRDPTTGRELTKYSSFKDARSHQAVILAKAQRQKDGKRWTVEAVERVLHKGNIYDLGSISNAITDMENRSRQMNASVTRPMITDMTSWRM
eukprot:gnl/TRDRNA2_/TRDRNA2_80166_c0_seq2.p1 gnl/TRDRNA2_/TRDRNA2_80166_c0~~gnl/TRDRNA2_/TRDRNA2_80166_c0_seq2.p1  ORF type:complete len:401 (-),score=83.32 gnl/TRDRNA2_/TRDRNA2_80166_c0_seq2:239-1441(-)